MLLLEQPRPADRVDVSVVVPVYNEQENLPELLERLTKVLSGLDRTYEMVFVDDGSSDGSVAWLRERARQDKHLGVVEFQANFGQHAAVFAGLEAAAGDAVVTLDADLQNPPEEIPKLLAALDEGHDVAAGWRSNRQDPLLRRVASYLVNRLMSRATGVNLHDYGCMLRAYRCEVVDCLCACAERSSFIPALANVFARSVVEVPVEHAARARGDSKYSLRKLVSLNYDLLTGFSVLPIHWVSSMGLLMALAGFASGAFLLLRRLLMGPEAEGVFTLMAVLFVFTGLQLLAVGMVGQYIARTYSEARARPRYVVRKLHGRLSSASCFPAPANAPSAEGDACPE